MENERKGSLTVFISLILLLLLALLMTVCEAAYTAAGRQYAGETVKFCSEGILGQYERELWEDYGLLAYRDNHAGGVYADDLSSLLERNFGEEGEVKTAVQNSKEEAGEREGLLRIPSIRLLPLAVGEIKTKENIYLLDDDGKWYQKQLSHIVKKEAEEDLIARVKDALSSFDVIGNCMEVVQAEMQAMESIKELYDDMRAFSDEASCLSLKPVKQIAELAENMGELVEGGKQTSEGRIMSEEEVLVKLEEIKADLLDIQDSCEKQAEHIRNMKQLFSDIQKQAAEAGSAIEHFSKVLSGCKAKLPKENVSEFEAKLQTLKNYADGKSADKVGRILQKNEAILKGIAELPTEEIEECSPQNLQQLIEKCSGQLGQYELGDIETMILEEEKEIKDTENPLKLLQKLLKNGVMGLLLDTEALSDLALEENREEAAKERGMDKFFSRAEDLDFDISALDAFSELKQSLSGVQTAAGKFLEKIYICRYGNSYFQDFTETAADVEKTEENVGNMKTDTDRTQSDAGKDGIGQKMHKLAYEAEYQIEGKMSDRDNLSAFISQLLLIRTALNFAYVKADSGLKSKARSTSYALAGAVGAGAMAAIIENALLLGISYEEALVDVSALLHGKRVPFIKNRDSFCMQFEEIAIFGKSMIEKKRKSFPDKEAGIREGFSYGDYLTFLMLAVAGDKLMSRQCRLIEENMRLRYDTDYTLKDCLYGTCGEVRLELPNRFMGLGKHCYTINWAVAY